MEDKCILHPERDCIGKAAAVELEGRIKLLEEWKDGSKEFHEAVNKERIERANRDGKIDVRLGNIEGRIDGMDGKLDTLLGKPGKRWEAVVAAVIAALAGGIVTFILVNVGLG